MPEETTDLVLEPEALHVVHVSIAVEQITLQRSTRLLQTATKTAQLLGTCLLTQVSDTNNQLINKYINK